jgi:hypothetical protein
MGIGKERRSTWLCSTRHTYGETVVVRRSLLKRCPTVTLLLSSVLSLSQETPSRFLRISVSRGTRPHEPPSCVDLTRLRP